MEIDTVTKCYSVINNEFVSYNGWKISLTNINPPLFLIDTLYTDKKYINLKGWGLLRILRFDFRFYYPPVIARHCCL